MTASAMLVCDTVDAITSKSCESCSLEFHRAETSAPPIVVSSSIDFTPTGSRIQYQWH